ncbi:GvpL/GvpF family gas vesicle protein [Streptomyces sp. NPDC059766]|uniref:GvpL/GvpF family gas vesicle protein n=1 Tax=Streptomyces sp. NPDC059766 TaxID=3346940 RepID=UPI00364749E7
MTDAVTYAYAVVRHDAEGIDTALAGVVGVAGKPVHLVPQRPGSDLAAVVSTVPAQDFQESALRRHLEDLDWLETVARAHHTVIEILSAHTTVLPLRLATVYLDEDRVRGALRDDADMFTRALDRLAGHIEWGVKIYVEPRAETAGPADPAADDGLGAGRAYLRARRAQRHSRDEAHRAASQAAERVEEIGDAVAAAHARHRVQQGELASGAGENVVNDAYLVAREKAETFRTEILRAAEGLPGIRVDVTGPWAPYSFAAQPGTEPRAPEAPDKAP